MNKTRLIWIAIACLMAAIAVPCFGTTMADASVELSATTSKTPPSITLNWLATATVSSTNPYVIYRRQNVTDPWVQVATPAMTDRSWTDTNVSVGAHYEYRVDCNYTANFANGFIYMGIEVPLVENRGKLILLVDSAQSSGLLTELTRFTQDLAGDGWTVIRHDVAAASSTAAQVKAIIQADYNSDPTNVKQVFLFGHLPVYLSGPVNPDGHGARPWPADEYYGDMNNAWPGDNTETYMPAPAQLQIGRVDMALMDYFPVAETDLLRRYLNKDHNFRTKQFVPMQKAMVDANFGWTPGTGFPISEPGWRSFPPCVGADNVVIDDWTNAAITTPYLLAEGDGPGLDDSAQGVITTTQLTTMDPAVFTILSGSHFGEWEHPDNLMRAVTATPNYGLTCSYGIRSFPLLHPMGLGETIGFCTQLLANNSAANYAPGDILNPGVGYITSCWLSTIGDPSLRLVMVAPPTSLSVSSGDWGVDVSWAASTDTVLGYYVYRSTLQLGPYTRITPNYVTGTTYRDVTAPVGQNYYMVRAVLLQTTPSGSYYNASQGPIISCNAITVLPAAATPVFSPDAGNYSSIQSVTITSTSSGATIRYTTDGTTPTETSGTIYSGPIQLSSNTTLRAAAYGNGTSISAVCSATYTFQPVQKDRLADVKSMSGGNFIAITSAKVAEVASGTYSDGSIYVSEIDRCGGLKVLGAGAVSIGDNLSITGFTDTDSLTGETILRATDVTKGSNTSFFALGMANKSLTPSGQLVTVWGKVTGVSSTYFTIDDGSTQPARVETDGLVVPLVSLPSIGDYVSATGPAGMMAGGVTAVRVRSQADVQDLMKCSTPTFTPAPGLYSTHPTVTISSNTGGATIRYTTDGTDPSETNGAIGNSVTITNNCTLKAIAYRAGIADSAIASGSYTVEIAAPTFSPVAGSYSSPQTVNISSVTPGVTIRYTTDGTDPSETNGTVGTSVYISADTTLKAIAYMSGVADSNITSGFYHIYQITCATPTFSLVSGTYVGTQTVTISTTTPGATIRYTTDGSIPTETNGTIGTTATISSNCTLQAIAYMNWAIDSGVASASYTILSHSQTYGIVQGIMDNTNISPATGYQGVLATQTGSDGWWYRIDITSTSPYQGAFGSSYAFKTNLTGYPLCPSVFGPGSSSYTRGWSGNPTGGTGTNMNVDGFICNSNEMAAFNLYQSTAGTALGFAAGWQTSAFPTMVTEWRAPQAGMASANFLCYSQQGSGQGAHFVMGLYRSGVFAQYLNSTTALGPTNYGTGHGAPLTASSIMMNAGDSIVIVSRSAQGTLYGTRQMDTSVGGNITFSW